MAYREVQPLYLLADSQILFWQSLTGPYLKSILGSSKVPANPKIAYIGASNGDSPEAHAIFAAAIEQLDSPRPHHVRASYSADDRKFLGAADVVVLAGGEVETGWNAFMQSG